MSVRTISGTLAAATFVATVLVTAAQATAITYKDTDSAANGVVRASGAAVQKRNAFFTTLAPTSQTETFGPRPNPSVGAVSINSYSLFGSGVATLTASAVTGKSEIQDTSGFPNDVFPGRFDTSGNLGMARGETGRWFQTSRNFTIDFVSDQNAFGTYITDIGDFGGTLSATFIGAGLTETVTFTPGGGGQGALSFLGYTNDMLVFNKVIFAIAQGTGPNIDPNDADTFDVIGFDDMIIGRLRNGGTAPEPSSVALVGLSLGLMTWGRRRRATAN